MRLVGVQRKSVSGRSAPDEASDDALNAYGLSDPMQSWSLKESAVHGRGAFTTGHMRAGESLGVSHYAVDKTVTQTTALGSAYNHSDQANFAVRRTGNSRELIAQQPIAPQTEVLVDYRQSGDVRNLEQPERGWRGAVAQQKTECTKGACGCSACSKRAVQRAIDTTTQRMVVQRQDSESEWEPSSGEEECQSTYAYTNCDLKPQYAGRIRRYFYPSSYWSSTMSWMRGELTRLEDSGNSSNFECPECNSSVAKSNATIDHITPVSQHWNDYGHDQTQGQRASWYNDTSNHQVMCGSCNSSLGGVSYDRTVGPNFCGPGE